MIIPKYKIGTTIPIDKQKVLDFFSVYIEYQKENAVKETYVCKGGSILILQPSEDEKQVWVKFHVNIEKDFYGKIWFMDFCRTHHSLIQNLRTKVISPVSDGAIMSEIYNSKEFRIANHFMSHPKDLQEKRKKLSTTKTFDNDNADATLRFMGNTGEQEGKNLEDERLKSDNEFPIRIHQDENFIVNGFSGKQLEQLIGLELIEEPGIPFIVFIKAEDNRLQRFFLDAGIGFWEYAESMEDEEEEVFVFVDYIQKFNIKNRKISNIYCEKQHNVSQIVLVLEDSQKFLLRYKNPEIVDSECELVLVKAEE